jgi:hypothetical protein
MLPTLNQLEPVSAERAGAAQRGAEATRDEGSGMRYQTARISWWNIVIKYELI